MECHVSNMRFKSVISVAVSVRWIYERGAIDNEYHFDTEFANGILYSLIIDLSTFDSINIKYMYGPFIRLHVPCTYIKGEALVLVNVIKNLSKCFLKIETNWTWKHLRSQLTIQII